MNLIQALTSIAGSMREGRELLPEGVIGSDNAAHLETKTRSGHDTDSYANP